MSTSRVFRVRTEGNDLVDPDTRQPRVAIDEHSPNGWAVAGYSPDVATANLFIASVGNDQQFRSYMEKRNKVQLSDEDRQRVEAERYAASVAQDDDREVRQQMRRSKAFEELFTAVFDRKEAGLGAQFLRVTFEEWQSMMSEYQDAHAHGMANKCDFQPLSAYSHKIVQMNDDGTLKRQIRPIFQNEVGVVTIRGQSKIVLLKDQGPGDLGDKYHQVPNAGGDFK